MEFGSPEHPYTVMNTDEGGVVGIGHISRTPDTTPSWVGYIAVDNADAAVQQLAKAGGTVRTPAEDVPGMLRLANVADSQGAPFVIYHGLQDGAPPTGAPGASGYVGWRELVATDAATAFDFYSGLFGWTKSEAYDMGPLGPYQLFAAGAENIGGMMSQPDKGQPPHWNYYFRVDATGAAVERVKAAGGTLIYGPHQVPSDEWVAQCADPQGVAFCLVSINP
jgi:predicted enzyme related to lactoylglutathione lyase